MLRALIFRYAQRIHGKKLTRNRIYSASAWLIIIGVVLRRIGYAVDDVASLGRRLEDDGPPPEPAGQT